MADFPPAGMVAKEDSKYRSQKQDDPAMSSNTEGGYTITRPRYTRAPRKTFSTGFTDVSDADKVLFETFWETKKGGSDSFTWTDPVSGSTKTVRFVGQPNFKYVGMGSTFRWDITDIQLKEV